MHVYRLSSALALTALVVAAACSDNTSPTLSAFYANMTGDQVVPAVTTAATSQATIANFTGSAEVQVKVTYTLTPTRISIDSGVGCANGRPMADLCGGAAAACSTFSSGATFTGVRVGGYSLTQLYGALKNNGSTNIAIFTAAHPAVVNGTTGVITGGENRGPIVYTPAAP